MDMEKQTRAYLYAGATVLCWATVASAFKLSLQHLSAVELLLYSSCRKHLPMDIVWAVSMATVLIML